MDQQQYRQLMLNFIDKNKQEIAKIYQIHAEQDGSGIIVLDYIEQDDKYNINVIFVKRDVLPNEILSKVNDRSKENNSHIIYIYMITPFEEQLIELDFRDLIH